MPDTTGQPRWERWLFVAGAIVAIAWGPGAIIWAAFKKLPLETALWIILVWFASLIAILLWQFVRTRRELAAVRPSPTDAERAATAIISQVPEAGPIVDFLKHTLFAGRSAENLRAIDQDHYLRSYARDFDIFDRDIVTRDHLVGTNMSATPTLGPPLVSYGGSMRRLEDLNPKAWQMINGKEEEAELVIEIDEERFKLMRARLREPLPTGEKFDLRYEDHWPEAMMYGFDAVIYTPVLYFARGIEELSSTLRFPRDERVTHIAGYMYDLDSGICQLADPDQPAEDVSRGDEQWSAFQWGIRRPSNTALYFVCFVRSVATS